jgi:hypothetical protein
MEYDPNKVDDVVLALLYLNLFDDGDGNIRAWKSLNWDAMDRLFEKGFIDDPRSKSKSVFMSEEGILRAEELFRRFFVV